MNKASPVDLRKALEVAQVLARAGILFVPMPVNGQDQDELIQRNEEAQMRLDRIVVETEQQGAAVIKAKQLAVTHGSILRHRRYAAGLTASDAASLLGIGTLQLRSIEAGDIPAPADADTWYKLEQPATAERSETEMWEWRACKEATRAHDLEQQRDELLAAAGILADRLFDVPPGVDIALDAIRVAIAKVKGGAA